MRPKRDSVRVLFFDLDCIRDDHLGCYGYHRDTSPNIDRLAADASRFTSCYTSNAPCVPARAALFSGRFGINTGVATNSGRALRFPPRSGPGHRDRCPMWMRHLTANGMRPVSFSNFADRHGAWWFHEGWKEFHLVNLRRGHETADEVNAVALPWFRDHGGENNWFAHVHYWDIHQPYRIPDMPKHLERFRGEPLPEWPDAEVIARHFETSHGPRTAHELWPGVRPWSAKYPWMPDTVSNLDEFRAIIDGYDASIRYVDEHVGQILGVLADHGVLDETVIVVTGDHGDCFGECGGHYTDHWIGAEPLLRRPLVIRWPGARSEATQATCDEMVYLLDLAPTVCEMLGMPVPDLWDGRSFAPALRGEPFTGYDHVICENGLGAMQRIVRSREWAYVRTYNPGQHTMPAPEALYDMKTDPQMSSDVAPARPDVALSHRAMLDEWWHEQLPRHAPRPDPFEEVARPNLEQVRRTVARLRDEGRAEVADRYARLIERYCFGADLG